MDPVEKAWTLGVRLLAAAALAVPVAACGDDPVAAPGVEPLEPSFAGVPGPPPMERMQAEVLLGQGNPVAVVDGDCNPAFQAADGTPLFFVPIDAAGCEGNTFPLTDPDGNQMTLGEWDDASGSVKIMCKDGGTSYRFKLRGLVPGGVYTIWHFSGTGGGALASHMGDINNVFQANKAGVANFETFGTPGAMTFFGVAQECTLPLPQSPVPGTFEDEIFVVVYHVDNRTWGPFPGPTETYTGHLIFLLP